MPLEEAIEILVKFHDQAACTLDATSANAFQLGIEALNRLGEMRRYEHYLPSWVLPGETEGRTTQRHGKDIRGSYSYEEPSK